MKQFGETVPGYTIPVLNEREIRAAAGILFLFTFLALMQIIFNESFLMIKYVITLFMSDFAIRIFISPKYAPSLIIGRLCVSRQNPEYVGAVQKKFAWNIGFALSFTMFVLMVLVNSYSIITGLICLICLVFLFFESAFGICLGCLMYPLFYKDKVQYCPGEICDVKAKHDIQKTSKLQITMLVLFAVFTIAIVYFFNAYLVARPIDLWKILGSF